MVKLYLHLFIGFFFSLFVVGCSSARERHANDRRNLRTTDAEVEQELIIPDASNNEEGSCTSVEYQPIADPQPVSGLMELARVTSNQPQQVIQHIGYTVSYNPSWFIPNWVAYELTLSEVNGSVPRSNDFAPDPEITDPVMEYEYKGSGYDRGHMAPAADMKWSRQAMSESFYMSNMCPQNHNLNDKDWKYLEEHVRGLAQRFDNVYVCCGPIVTSTEHTIGSYHSIVVPQAFYKVLLRRKGDSWSAIGFRMENKSRSGKFPLSHFAMSVNELENVCGIDFFYSLSDHIEEEIESSYNLSDWNL